MAEPGQLGEVNVIDILKKDGGQVCLYGKASSRREGVAETGCAYMAEPGQPSGGRVAVSNQVCLYGRAD